VQGTAIVAAVALALRLRPAASASTRAFVWAVTLLAVPAVGVLLGVGVDLRTYVPTWTASLAPVVDPVRASLTVAGGIVDPPAAASRTHAGATATSLLVWLWVTAAMLKVGHLCVGLATLRRWRARCRPLDPALWHRLPAWTSLRDSGRRAHVVMSPDVRSPCVLGLWRPRIALPPSALTMPAEALDAVLVHEYAHVQRRDDLAQFAQHVIAAICVLHPGVWWADRMLTLEREAACDDWVVLLASPTRTYASCLLTLATGGRLDTAALQVSVSGGRSQLAGRVRRLIDPRRHRRLHASWAVRTAVPAAVALLVGSMTTAAGPRHATPAPTAVISRVAPAPRIPASVTRPAAPNSTRAAERPVPWGTPASARPDRSPPARRHQGETEPPPGRPVYPEATPPMHADLVPSADEAGNLALAAVPLIAVSGVADALSPVRPFAASAAADVTTTPFAPDPSEASEPGAPGPFTEAGRAVADTGVSIGKGAARGGVATGAFFTRLGKRVARTF
jgi:beta-lactamase regulating signal transducer with metallopeptidase domain